ncbi:hypothetical protein PAPHI01_0633 [Pancytospora philotis]|nr:hypothetical protein PAPHI01_0633 [Pancytospora philotis]
MQFGGNSAVLMKILGFASLLVSAADEPAKEPAKELTFSATPKNFYAKLAKDEETGTKRWADVEFEIKSSVLNTAGALNLMECATNSEAESDWSSPREVDSSFKIAKSPMTRNISLQLEDTKWYRLCYSFDSDSELKSLNGKPWQFLVSSLKAANEKKADSAKTDDSIGASLKSIWSQITSNAFYMFCAAVIFVVSVFLLLACCCRPSRKRSGNMVEVHHHVI